MIGLWPEFGKTGPDPQITMNEALGQIVIVSIKDGRRFYGRWVGVDAKKTLLLDDVLEELPAQGLSKTACHIETVEKYTTPLDHDRVVGHYADFSYETDPEKRLVLQKKFMENKLRHQAVVIPGESIVRVELQKVKN